MALSLSRPKHRFLSNYPLVHRFSSSSSSSSPPGDDHSTPQEPTTSQPQHQQQQSSSSSYFSDVKSRLSQEHQKEETRPNFNVERDSSTTTSRTRLEDIRKTLTEYRQRSPDQGSDSSQQGQPISFQDLYKRNVISKSGTGTATSGFTFDRGNANNNKPGSAVLSFDKIRESLRKMGSNSTLNANRRTPGGSLLRSGFGKSLRLGQEQAGGGNVVARSNVIGGTQELPVSVFGKEMNKEDESDKERMSTEFLKPYTHLELGEKLRSLRPEGKEGEKRWFSLQELNERLKKLRELEEKQIESGIGGLYIRDLRDSLTMIKKLDEDEVKKSAIRRLSMIGQLSSSPNFKQLPPKEHLIEKYVHPDNMSSAEKMKIELAKVRDEFKMSESDCGSARVQVAQLTTKIKHLSAVLHKKDKHSRKGLQEMVQRRKKLLKYLRRTDWDSYCFVISKLGLRDNPDFKESYKRKSKV